ncbi:Protein kinase domain containing protein, partial [Aphelenchoides avenae]
RLPWSSYRHGEKQLIKKLKEHARTTEGAYELLKYTPRNEFRRIMKYLDGLKNHGQPDYCKQTY